MKKYEKYKLDDGSLLTEQEKWILKQVEIGDKAELVVEFGFYHSHRHIRANFLEKLISGNFKDYKTPNNRICIKNAIIYQKINLSNAKILNLVELIDCRFLGSIDFSDSNWEKSIILDKSHFLDYVNFIRVKIENSFFLRDVTFHSQVNFNGIRIGRELFMKGASFEDLKKGVRFDGINIGHNAYFNETKFFGPVSFSGAEIGGEFHLEKAKFNNKDNVISFNWLKVGHWASLKGAVFEGPVVFTLLKIEGSFIINYPDERINENTIFNDSVDFGGSIIAGQFLAIGACFNNSEKTVHFDGLNVKNEAVFENAKFNGKVTFNGVKIEKGFYGRGIRFYSEEKSISFRGLKVVNNLNFDNAVFFCAVDFSDAEIGGHFFGHNTHFLNENKASIFQGIKVGMSAHFEHSIFLGGVDFRRMEVNHDFLANKAQFSNENFGVNFENCKILRDVEFSEALFCGTFNFSHANVGGNIITDNACFNKEDHEVHICNIKANLVTFGDTIFKGNLCLHFSNILDLFIGYDKNKNINIKKIDLEQTNIKRELYIYNLNINNINARNMHCDIKASLINIHIKKIADFQNSYFEHLNLNNVSWPGKKERVLLDGINFNSISAGDETKDCKKLLKWIEGSKFNRQPYIQLEAYFQRTGQREWADKVFMSMKKQEEEIATNIWDWLWNSFIRLSVGHGRQVRKALFYSIAIIFLGTLIFWDREGMIPKKLNDGSISITIAQSNETQLVPYQPFWYSLDLFLPIDLGMSKYWEPSPERPIAWHYSKVHMILGWVLITILVAAAIGIIK